MKSSISKKQLRQFGFVIGFGFPIIIGFFIPIISGHAFKIWTIWLGIPFLLAGKICPNLLFYPFKLWMRIGLILGWINSRIILSVVFIVVLQPISLIMKIFGYDPLRQKKVNQKSYREINEKSIELTRIF